MCVSPRLVPNKARNKGIDCEPLLHDNESLYIYVPCGVCEECVKLKQCYLVQRIQMESLTNHLFFCTLTYRKEALMSTFINGFEHSYANISDFQKMVKMLRKYNVFKFPFKYFAVTEYGGKKHRPHFHVIFTVPKQYVSKYDMPAYEHYLHDAILKYWRRNVGSTRSPEWFPLCVYIQNAYGRNYDFHYVHPYKFGKKSDVAFYVTKYICKYDSWIRAKQQALRLNCDDSLYSRIWNLLRPRVLSSKGIGISDESLDYLEKGVNVALDSSAAMPYYISPDDGKVFPLSPYFRKRVLSLEQVKSFKLNSDKNLSDSTFVVDTELPDVHRIKQKNDKFDRNSHIVERVDFADIVDY